VFSSVRVEEDVVLSSQSFGPRPGCDGLLQGLVLEPGVHSERQDGRLSVFAVYVYLEGTRLAEREVEEVIMGVFLSACEG